MGTIIFVLGVLITSIIASSVVWGPILITYCLINKHMDNKNGIK